MLVTTALGTAPTYTFGATPDANSKLSVKQYGAVWASYNSKVADDAIRLMQSRMNLFSGMVGRTPQPVDGKVGDSTLSFVKSIADMALQRGIVLQGGFLKGVALSKQTLAERAHVAADLLTQILDVLGIDVRVVTPMPTPPTPRQPATPSFPDQVPVLPPELEPYDPNAHASPGIFGKKHWAWYLAGGILFAGLAAATVIVWKS